MNSPAALQARSHGATREVIAPAAACGCAARGGPVRQPGGPAEVVEGLLAARRARAPQRAAQLLHAQRTLGNHAVQRQLQRPAAGSAGGIQRLGLEDVVPDAILEPIRSMVQRVGQIGADLSGRSDRHADAAQTDASTTAEQAEREGESGTGAARGLAEGATAQASAQSSASQAQAQAAAREGETEAGQMQRALPAAQYASDPVASVVQAPPAAQLPGGVQAATQSPAQSWNCDEAAIVGQVSALGRRVAEGAARLVRSVVPDSVLRFAQGGIARLRSAMATIRSKLDGARRFVGQWLENRLRPIREGILRAQRAVQAVVDAASRAISGTLAQIRARVAERWSALKNGVRSAIEGVIEWARNGASDLLARARRLAGRLWDALPDAIKGPLAGAAEALAGPIRQARQGLERAVAWVESKAAWLRSRLTALADAATQWVARKYQQVRAIAAPVLQAIGNGAAWLRDRATALGRDIYNGIDRLSGGRLTKWREAAARRFAELRGDVCAATGAAAGPCVERFVPEPVGAGKSFATLTTKADITVPIEGVPVKVAAGARITIERTARTYKAIIAGDGFVGLPIKLSGGGGGGAPGGPSGNVSVTGSLPNRALALLSLSGTSPGLPAVPVPIGATPQPAPPGAAGAGGGGVSASAEVGRRVGVALTYTFDATADKTTCDGLGGLTALLASQGAAALLPPPFSSLAATAGQAAFADHLTSAKFTVTDSASASAKVGAGPAEASAGVTAQSGVSLEARVDDRGGRSFIATLFQALSGDAALSFAPEGIQLARISAGLTGRQELGLTYTLPPTDTLDASLRQSLGGTLTLSAFSGFLGSLPPPIRDPIRRRLACLPDANQGSVAAELSLNVVNLRALALALDAELNKGNAATAAGVWNAVSGFLRNRDNCYLEFSARLTLTEQMLGVKAGGGDGQGVSGGAELDLSRGQEMILVPPTRLLQDSGASGPALGAPAGVGAVAAPRAAAAAPVRAAPAPTLPFFHGTTWRIAQTIPGRVRPLGGGDFGQGFYTHHDADPNKAAERARVWGCRLCKEVTPRERYAGVIRFNVASADYAGLTNRRDFGLTSTTQPDYAARQREWMDFVSGPGRGREACPIFDPAHGTWRHERVNPPPDQGLDLIEGPFYRGIPGLPGQPPPRSAFDPYAEGRTLPQQVVWNHDQAMAALNAAPTTLQQYDADNHCAPVNPPVALSSLGGAPVEDARASEAAQAAMTGA